MALALLALLPFGVRAVAAPNEAPTSVANDFVPGPVATDLQAVAQLDLDIPGIGEVKAAAQSGNLAAVQRAYLNYRRTASSARWKIMPSDKPAATEKTDVVGDEICNHYIRKYNYSFSFPGASMGKNFDWKHNPVPKGDPSHTEEWTSCCVSRFPFWDSLVDAYWKTNDEKYAVEWVKELRDFVAKNPLNHDARNGDPALWRTLDSAERVSGSWPNAYFHMLDSPSFDAESHWIYLRSMLDHVAVLTAGLNDSNRSGNWVVAECGALYTIGVLFPELKDAAAWRKLALDRFAKEIERMVPPDGFEAELTPTYHYFSLSSFLMPLELARLNHLPPPDTFLAKIVAMYRAPIWVMDQHGYVTATNDSGPYNAIRMIGDIGKTAHDPTLDWAVSGGKEGVQPPDSTMLPYAGFYALRGGWKRDDFFLFFRAGPTGMGHEHEDMLEIVVRAWNKTLLPEIGTYPYDYSDWRRYDIGTASHSTVIVDGKWQHRGPSKVPVTDPVNNRWVTTPGFDYVAATYGAGYQQNEYDPKKIYQPQKWVGPVDRSVSHTRRVLFLKPYYALVLDTLDGTGKHVFDAHFHLDAPAAHVDPATQAAFSDNTDSVQVGLYPLDREHLKTEIVQGQKEPMLGWFPEGHRPIPTVRFRKQQAAPAIFATFLYPYRNTTPMVEATPLKMTGEGMWGRSLSLPGEETEVALALDGSTRAFSLELPSGETVRTVAAGWIRRHASTGGQTFVGGWGLQSYDDGKIQFTLAAPGDVLIGLGAVPGKTFYFNASDKPVVMTWAKPFARTATLPPGSWTEVSREGALPASSPPPLFPPLAESGNGEARRIDPPTAGTDLSFAAAPRKSNQ